MTNCVKDLLLNGKLNVFLEGLVWVCSERLLTLQEEAARRTLENRIRTNMLEE